MLWSVPLRTNECEWRLAFPLVEFKGLMYENFDWIFARKPEKILVDWTTLRSITNVFPVWIPHLILCIKWIMCCCRMKQFPVFLCRPFPSCQHLNHQRNFPFFDHFKNKLDRPPWVYRLKIIMKTALGKAALTYIIGPTVATFSRPKTPRHHLLNVRTSQLIKARTNLHTEWSENGSQLHNYWKTNKQTKNQKHWISGNLSKAKTQTHESFLFSEVRQAWGICINQSFVQQPVLTSVFAL